MFRQYKYKIKLTWAKKTLDGIEKGEKKHDLYCYG